MLEMRESKMKTRKNLDELMATLENVRAKKYPDIPKELVEKIAIAQYNYQDDRAKARNETIKIVASYLDEFAGEEF